MKISSMFQMFSPASASNSEMKGNEKMDDHFERDESLSHNDRETDFEISPHDSVPETSAQPPVSEAAAEFVVAEPAVEPVSGSEETAAARDGTEEGHVPEMGVSDGAIPLWVDDLRNQMESLRAEFSAKLKYDAKKQEQIDQLYQENREYRDDVMEKCKKNLVLAVIEQIDDAEKQIAHFQKAEFSEVNYTKLLRSFSDMALSFRDMLLERFDVESWQSQPGTPFDPSRQRSLRTTPTTDPALAKTLCASIRFGYRKENGQVIRPEMTDVYVYDASPAESAAAAEESQTAAGGSG